MLARHLLRSVAVAVAAVVVVTATPAAPGGAQSDPSVSRTVTSGARALSVAPTSGLDPEGRLVEVTGTGFTTDDGRGIYVAFCAVPTDGQAPSPCGGAPGSSGGGAAWIAGDEAAIAQGATPFGPDGSFSTQVFVTATIGDLDCRAVRCAVVTRSDHRRIADRSDDLIVPVSFAGTDATTLPLAGSGAPSDAPDAQVSARIEPVATNPRPRLPVTVPSTDGRRVEVDDVARIVSLNGSLSEIVYTLGLGDRVVGRDVSATFKEAKRVPLVTRGHDVSAEAVLSRRPTVVLAQSDTGPVGALAQIRDAGVPVIVFDQPRSIDEIGAREQAVADALGVPEVGTRLRARTRGALRRVQADVPTDAEKPRVAFLYMRGQAGVYLIGGKGSGADSMIAAAGGIDAGTAMGLERAFTPITSESLAAAAPDVILMTTTGLESVGGIDGLVKVPGIAQTPAGRQRRVVTEEDGLLFSFGSRTPAALARLVDALHGAEPSRR